MYQPKLPVTSAADVKAILGLASPHQIAKVIDHIDELCAAWIARCPFIVISSINAAVDTCNAVSYHSGLPISVIDLEMRRVQATIRGCAHCRSTI